MSFEPNFMEYEGKWAFFYILVDESNSEIKLGIYLNAEDHSSIIDDVKCFQVLKQPQEIVVGNTRVLNGVSYAAFSGYLGVIISESLSDYSTYFESLLAKLRKPKCVTLTKPGFLASTRATVDFRSEEGF